jgi:M6 family metalloprotease-like protein
MEGCSPVVFVDGEETPLSSFERVWVSRGDTQYAITDLLMTPGTYSFKVRTHALDTVEASFQVTATTSEIAIEGQGYTQVTDEVAAKYSLMNVPYAGSLGQHKTPSRGNVKLLVIPVTFTAGATWTTAELSALPTLYFGAAEDTAWQSLASYYEASSYGLLHLSGQVASPYVSTYTEEQMQNNNGLTSTVLQQAIASAVTTDGINLKDYDSDGDGYIDGVNIVYKALHSYNSNVSNSSVWWNWTSTTSSSSSLSPAPYRYFWCNIKQLFTGYYGNGVPDAHTLVHETGHMLGLNDYYDYDTASYPTGGADMMELNIGDHDAYSKYLLGWVRPYVVDGTLPDFTITLNDFASSGDCILLRDTTTDPWNGTPYDEYLMLSYYTPTGLNEQDSQGYAEWRGWGTGSSYRYRGLQVFHVDERLYSRVGSSQWDPFKNTFTSSVYSYTDEVLNKPKMDGSILAEDYAFQASSNTKRYSSEVTKKQVLATNSSHQEIRLIPASGDSSLFLGKSPRNLGSLDALFGQSDFGARYNGFSWEKMSGCFSNDGFNDGSSLEYNFFVSEQTDTALTVRFVQR